MVTYGEWTQDPDLTVSDTVHSSNTFSPVAEVIDDYGHSVVNEVEQADSPRVITVGDLADAVTTAVNSAVVGGAEEGSPTGTSHNWGYEAHLIDGTWFHTSTWAASTWSWLWHVHAREGFEYYPNFYGPGDPDAIGIEFQDGPPFDPGNPFPFAPAPPVGLALSPDTVVAARVGDDTHPEGLVGSGWDTDIHAVYGVVDAVVAVRDDGGLRSTSGSEHQEPLGAELSLDFLADHGWECDLYTLTPGFIAPYYLPTDPGVEPGPPNGFVSYGWFLRQLVVLTTVRPPVYRFVYADTPPVTYRRVYPRDDGLAGGAPRTWPPSKGVQSSNRTFGGYL